jgi:16S rRNA (uracil1498-N3)-methyltransferase
LPLFYQPEIPNGILTLSRDESKHATKVLRLTSGDILDITDGMGCFYEARITNPDSFACSFTILKTKPQVPRPFHIHLGIAPTKNTDRLEWFVEKAVELGIDEVSFLTCQNSERKSISLDRLEKLTVSAMKQSQQAWLPKLRPLIPFKDILSNRATQKFIAFVDTKNPSHLKSLTTPNGNYLVLIGPEGDFSSSELQQSFDNGFQKVSLGPSRLRTETAGIAACHILNLVNQ